MAAGKFPLYVEQYASFARTLQWTEQDGTPIDLTGYGIAATILSTYSSSDAVSFLVTILDQTVPANVGKFTIALTNTQTANLPVSPAVNFENDASYLTYDIIATNGSTVKRLLQGAIIVSPGVSQ